MNVSGWVLTAATIILAVGWLIERMWHSAVVFMQLLIAILERIFGDE